MNKMTGFYKKPTCFSSASIDLEGGGRIILPLYETLPFKDDEKVTVSLKNENNLIKWDIELYDSNN